MVVGDKIKTTAWLGIMDEKDYLTGTIHHIYTVPCFDGSYLKKFWVRFEDGRLLPCIEEELILKVPDSETFIQVQPSQVPFIRRVESVRLKYPVIVMLSFAQIVPELLTISNTEPSPTVTSPVMFRVQLSKRKE